MEKREFEEIGARERASHEGLGITESDWEAAVGRLLASLDKFKVPQKEKDALLGAVSTLKPEIVASPAANK